MYNPFETINLRLSNIETLLLDLKHGNDQQVVITDKKHFTKREAAEELSCSVPMIDKLIKQELLDSIKPGAMVLNTRENQARFFTNKKCPKNQNYIIQHCKLTPNLATISPILKSQFQIVFNGFLNCPYTMKELSVITGIDRANICRYVRILRLTSKIAIYKKGYCSITKHKANFYTTNPEFLTMSKQLKLF